MTTSILFGIEYDDLQRAKAELEKHLSIRLDLHDSLYLGGDCYRHLSDDKTVEILLQKNIDQLFDPANDDPLDYWAEPEFCSHPLLVYIEVIGSVELANSIILQLTSGASLWLLREEQRE